jgi:hypothetical protein
MSIKKKFVTAITTAGLLAGLFGSAFVPSALARGGAGTAPAPGLSGWRFNVEDSNPDFDQSGVDVLSGADGGTAMSAVIASHQDTGEDDLSIGFELRDSDNDPIEVATLVATSTGFVEVGWALRERFATNQNGNGPYRPVDCDYNFMDDSAFALSDTVTNAKSDGDYDSFDGHHIVAGEFFLCFRVKDATKPGKSTITVTANGVKLTTITMTVLGDLASLTLSAKRGYTAVATGNAEISEFFTVVGKDSAGQAINQIPGIDIYLNDYTNEAITEAGSDELDVIEDAQGDTMDFVDNSFDNTSSLDLLASVCDVESYTGAGDADAGKSYALAVEMLNWDGDVITSNAVTASCTGADSKAVLSDIVAETATGEADWAASTAGKADSDGVIAIYATVKDSAGRLMGLDDTIGFDITLSADFDTELGLVEVESQVGPGGKIMLGYIVPDMGALAKYSYEVTIADSNFGTALDQELVKTLYYSAVSGIELDYSLSRVRNAAKTVATWTADYGVACSNARIEFNWENADGTKFGTVERRANIDGVAKFSLARRNQTIFVYAAGCDNYGAETDFVKARFR